MQQGQSQSSQKAPANSNGENFGESHGEGSGLNNHPYGLTHLAGMLLNGESASDLGALSAGQDLTQLGLDLTQPEYVVTVGRITMRTGLLTVLVQGSIMANICVPVLGSRYEGH